MKTGKLSFTFKYYPVYDMMRGASYIGESHWAEYAAECANEQGKFWDYHDKLFAVLVVENTGTYSKENLEKCAVDLRLDTAKFNQCLDTDKYAGLVQQDIDEATRLKVRGTPSFFANGRPINPKSWAFDEFARLFDLLPP